MRWRVQLPGHKRGLVVIYVCILVSYCDTVECWRTGELNGEICDDLLLAFCFFVTPLTEKRKWKYVMPELLTEKKKWITIRYHCCLFLIGTFHWCIHVRLLIVMPPWLPESHKPGEGFHSSEVWYCLCSTHKPRIKSEFDHGFWFYVSCSYCVELWL